MYLRLIAFVTRRFAKQHVGGAQIAERPGGFGAYVIIGDAAENLRVTVVGLLGLAAPALIVAVAQHDGTIWIVVNGRSVRRSRYLQRQYNQRRQHLLHERDLPP